MRYQVSLSPQAERLLSSAPPPVRNSVLRHLAAEDRERAVRRSGARLVFIFDEPMMLLEVGRYSVLYEVEPTSRTVRVRYASGPSKPASNRVTSRRSHRSNVRRSSGGPSSH